MGFRSGAYASVFSVERGRGNYYDVNIATSRKDKVTGNYNTDFRAFVRFAGDAAKGIEKYDGKSSKNNGNRPIARIRLGDVDTTNSYSPETNKTYTHHTVFTFDFVESSFNSGDATTGSSAVSNAEAINNYVNSMPSMSEDEEGLFT